MKVLLKDRQRKVNLDRKDLLRRLQRIGELLGLQDTELSILFVNDRQIRDLNRVYRGIDSTTDVLSFPFYTSLKEIKKAAKCGETLLGDIVVNLHIADRRAREEGKTVEDEVYHLLIHGLLHLLGYDHEKNRRQALAMKKKESELLDAVKKMD